MCSCNKRLHAKLGGGCWLQQFGNRIDSSWTESKEQKEDEEEEKEKEEVKVVVVRMVGSGKGRVTELQVTANGSGREICVDHSSIQNYHFWCDLKRALSASCDNF